MRVDIVSGKISAMIDTLLACALVMVFIRYSYDWLYSTFNTPGASSGWFLVLAVGAIILVLTPLAIMIALVIIEWVLCNTAMKMLMANNMKGAKKTLIINSLICIVSSVIYTILAIAIMLVYKEHSLITVISIIFIMITVAKAIFDFVRLITAFSRFKMRD